MKYFKYYLNERLFLACLIFLASGCSSVMHKTTLIDHADGDTALVNFVRPSIFLGDGLDYDLWDGNNFVGVLGSGTIVQYKTKPGAHVFMAKGRNWSYVKANLVGGKQYFIKGNVVPLGGIVLAAVDAQKDGRTKDWLKYGPREVEASKEASYVAGKKDDVEKAINNFNGGHVEYFELKPEYGL